MPTLRAEGEKAERGRQICRLFLVNNTSTGYLVFLKNGSFIMSKNQRITSILIMVILSWFISACGIRPIINAGGDKLYPDANEVPVASNFKTAFQYKLQAVDHWNNIANDLAASITESIRKKFLMQPSM